MYCSNLVKLLRLRSEDLLYFKGQKGFIYTTIYPITDILLRYLRNKLVKASFNVVKRSFYLKMSSVQNGVERIRTSDLHCRSHVSLPLHYSATVMNKSVTSSQTFGHQYSVFSGSMFRRCRSHRGRYAFFGEYVFFQSSLGLVQDFRSSKNIIGRPS